MRHDYSGERLAWGKGDRPEWRRHFEGEVEISGGTPGQPIYALTNPFGYYSLSDLQAGQSYTVTVSAKGRTFAQPTRIVNLGDDLTGVDFMSME